jgi:hypothetical protein
MLTLWKCVSNGTGGVIAMLRHHTMEVHLYAFLSSTLAVYHTFSIIYPWVGPRHGLATIVKRKVYVGKQTLDCSLWSDKFNARM